MRYSIFLLDADDTIFDFQTAAGLALEKAFNDCGVGYKPEYKQIYHRINGELWKRLERKEITRDDLIRLRFSAVLKELGIDYDYMKLNGAYVKALGECSVFLDGAEEFLNELKKFGRIFIVTNGFTVTQQARLKKFGMEKYADDYFISEQVGYDKPDPRFMEYVFSNIPDFDRNKAVLIGDSATSDMKSAMDSGIDGFWFNPKGNILPEGIKITYEGRSYGDIIDALKLS